MDQFFIKVCFAFDYKLSNIMKTRQKWDQSCLKNILSNTKWKTIVMMEDYFRFNSHTFPSKILMRSLSFEFSSFKRFIS